MYIYDLKIIIVSVPQECCTRPRTHTHTHTPTHTHTHTDTHTHTHTTWGSSVSVILLRNNAKPLPHSVCVCVGAGGRPGHVLLVSKCSGLIEPVECSGLIELICRDQRGSESRLAVTSEAVSGDRPVTPVGHVTRGPLSCLLDYSHLVAHSNIYDIITSYYKSSLLAPG